MSVGRVREINGQLIPLYPIYVQGPIGIADVYHAVLDTGFTGQLALPKTIREELGLEFLESMNVKFGNTRVERVDTYRAMVYWNDDWREITVLETGDRPLIGMNLLRDSKMFLAAVDHGDIKIGNLYEIQT